MLAKCIACCVYADEMALLSLRVLLPMSNTFPIFSIKISHIFHEAHWTKNIRRLLLDLKMTSWIRTPCKLISFGMHIDQNNRTTLNFMNIDIRPRIPPQYAGSFQTSHQNHLKLTYHIFFLFSPGLPQGTKIFP